MTIESKKDAGKLILTITGRIDTGTAPKLEEILKESYDGITGLVIDLAKVEYISSAGLRVLLSAQKIMNKQGDMKIINVSEDIMEIFEVTGFSDILTIA